MTFEEAVDGIEIPEEIRATLALVTVPYVSFEQEEKEGQLVVDTALAEEVESIFHALHSIKFPIAKMVPVCSYGWDDLASMEDNNTSAFTYRPIIGMDTLSNHSYGRAIDINPVQNPYYALDGKTYPEGAVYDPSLPGTITKECEAAAIFRERGWRWLGEREQNKDYQHFDKPLSNA